MTTGGKPWSQRLVRHRPPFMGPGPARQGWLPRGSCVGRIGRGFTGGFRWPGHFCRHGRHGLPFRGMVACIRPQRCVHSHFETRFSPGTLYLSDTQSLLTREASGTSGAYPSFPLSRAGWARRHSPATRCGTRCVPEDTRSGRRIAATNWRAMVKWCLSKPEGGVGTG